MLRTLLHQTGVQQVQSMYTHRSKEKFGYLHVDHINNCWFARDVTVVCWWSETKSVSLLWELNSIFMYILRKNSVVLTTNTIPTWPPCDVVASQEFLSERLACERS